MKLFRLSTIFTLFMLTGALDFLISAVPLMVTVWVFASGLLALTGIARRLERDRDLGLVRIPLTK
jgi:hypothetical protein